MFEGGRQKEREGGEGGREGEERGGEIERHTDRQTDRQTEKKTQIQREKQTTRYVLVQYSLLFADTTVLLRCALERDEDMTMTGTRHPFLGKYKVEPMSTFSLVSLSPFGWYL